MALLEHLSSLVRSLPTGKRKQVNDLIPLIFSAEHASKRASALRAASAEPPAAAAVAPEAASLSSPEPGTAEELLPDIPDLPAAGPSNKQPSEMQPPDPADPLAGELYHFSAILHHLWIINVFAASVLACCQALP